MNTERNPGPVARVAQPAVAQVAEPAERTVAGGRLAAGGTADSRSALRVRRASASCARSETPATSPLRPTTRARFLRTLGLAALLHVGPPAPAAVEPSLIGAWPAAARMSDVRAFAPGEVAGRSFGFIAAGACGLHIVSLTNSALPTPTAVVDTPGTAVAVAFAPATASHGPGVLVADGLGGLITVDVRDPAHPRPIGSYDGGGAITDVLVSGNTAWVADANGGVVGLDIRDLSAPRILGRVALTGRPAALALSGTTLCVADAETGLRLLDVADPIRPRLRSVFASDSPIGALSVGGSRLVFADAEGRVGLVELRDPLHPQLLGRWRRSGLIRGLALVDSRIIAAGGTLDMLDTAEGADAVFRSVVLGLEAVRAVTTVGSIIWALDGARGLRGFNYTGTGLLPPLGRGLPVPGRATGVAWSEGYAWLADGVGGLRVLSLSNPADPGGTNREARLLVGGDVLGVALRGNRLLLAAGSAGLVIADVSQPLLPRLTGQMSLDTPGLSAVAVSVDGDLAGVAIDGFGLAMVNVSDPARPRLVSAFPNAGRATGVLVTNGLALLAADTEGLLVLDVSTPSKPVLTGQFAEPGLRVLEVAVRGSRALVAADSAGLLVLDLSAPGHPLQVARADTSGLASRVVLAGDLAFVADGAAGVEIFDVMESDRPAWRFGYRTGGTALGLAVTREHLLVADESRLLVLAVPGLTSEPNLPPTIDGVVPLEVEAGGRGVTLTLRLRDDRTAPGDLVLRVSSANPQLLPVGALEVTGAEADRRVTILPPADSEGTTSLRLEVRDTAGLAVTIDVPVRILARNLPPTIEGGALVRLESDGVSSPVVLTLSDDRTLLSQLRVEVQASDESLFPPGSLLLSGAGAVRTLVLAPAPGTVGTAEVRISVTDEGGSTAVRSLPVAVVARAEAPPADACSPEVVPPGYGTFTIRQRAWFEALAGDPAIREVDADAAITLRAPAGQSLLQAVTRDPAGRAFELSHQADDGFEWRVSGDEESLTRRFGEGAWSTSYRVNLADGAGLNGFFPFTLSSRVPPIPRLDEPGAAVDPARAVRVSWEPWRDAAGTDRANFELSDAAGRLVFSAGSECTGDAGLAPDADGVWIPAGRMIPGSRYEASLTFRAQELAVTDHAPLLVLRAWHERTTRIGLTTLAAGDPRPASIGGLTPLPGAVACSLRGPPGTLCRLESSTDLRSWTVVDEVRLTAAGAGTALAPVSEGPTAAFFRAAPVNR